LSGSVAHAPIPAGASDCWPAGIHISGIPGVREPRGPTANTGRTRVPFGAQQKNSTLSSRADSPRSSRPTGPGTTRLPRGIALPPAHVLFPSRSGGCVGFSGPGEAASCAGVQSPTCSCRADQPTRLMQIAHTTPRITRQRRGFLSTTDEPGQAWSRIERTAEHEESRQPTLAAVQQPPAPRAASSRA